MDEFILNTDDLNEYGFRILTSGIQIEKYQKNPVALLGHIRMSDWNTPKPEDKLPIGNFLELKKLPNNLTAKLRMDDITALDKAVKAKIASGTLRAASIHIKILEWSEDPAMLVQGQTRPTVTKCELLEASVVDIPGNGYCVKLSYGDKEVILTGNPKGEDKEKLDSILPIIQLKQKDEQPMKTVILQLKLKENASEAEVLAAVTHLENEKLNLQNKVTELEKKVAETEKSAADTKAKSLVQLAIDQKKITESQRASWEQLALSNYDSAKAALDSMQVYVSLASQVQTGSKTPMDLDDKALYDKNWKEGKLEAWLSSNPDEFKRCYKAYFNAEYKD